MDERIMQNKESVAVFRTIQYTNAYCHFIIQLIITYIIGNNIRNGNTFKYFILSAFVIPVVTYFISYYIYKKGIEGGEYSLSTAAGLFNSVINCIFVVTANKINGFLE